MVEDGSEKFLNESEKILHLSSRIDILARALHSKLKARIKGEVETANADIL